MPCYLKIANIGSAQVGEQQRGNSLKDNKYMINVYIKYIEATEHG